MSSEPCKLTAFLFCKSNFPSKLKGRFINIYRTDPLVLKQTINRHQNLSNTLLPGKLYCYQYILPPSL